MRSRLALSLLTLLQLGLAIAAASQVRDLIAYGTEILPRAVLLVFAVLASAIVAARATFGRPESLTSRTALFIVCQLVSMVTILVLLFGPGPSGLALPFTPLPPNEIFGSQWALATISYALLLTIPVAVSTLAVAGWHLYVHAPASGASVIPRSLGFWVLGAVCQEAGGDAPRSTAAAPRGPRWPDAPGGLLPGVRGLRAHRGRHRRWQRHDEASRDPADAGRGLCGEAAGARWGRGAGGQPRRGRRACTAGAHRTAEAAGDERRRGDVRVTSRLGGWRDRSGCGSGGPVAARACQRAQ